MKKRRTIKLSISNNNNASVSATSSNADTFGYNTRSEVMAVPILSNAYVYSYDSIGNHTTSTVNAASTKYTANNLNQYAAILNAPRLRVNRHTILTETWF